MALKSVEFEKALAALPTFDGVAKALLPLLKDNYNEKDEQRFIATVRQDPAISARILKFTNSPLNQLVVPINTIKHAISMNGLQAIVTVALTFRLAKSFTLCRARLLTISHIGNALSYQRLPQVNWQT